MSVPLILIHVSKARVIIAVFNKQADSPRNAVGYPHVVRFIECYTGTPVRMTSS